MSVARNDKGFSLLEVVIATGIIGLMCAGVLTAIYRTDLNNRYLFGHTVAARAAHQTMEILLSQDIDTMVLQHGNSFAVFVPKTGQDTGTVTIDSAAVINGEIASGDYARVLGTIFITPLDWTGPGKAYSIRVEIPDFGVVLIATRARA